MRRTSRGWGSVALLVAFGGGACTRAQDPIAKVPPAEGAAVPPSIAPAPPAPVTSAPPGAASAHPSASASAPAPPEPPPAAWTDAPIVAELAKDCAYAPPGVEKMDEDASVLACAGGLFAQACVADPCYAQDQEDCKPKCQRTCNTCSSACVTACTACKKPCKDDACKAACAATCGACKQGCLTAKDRCATGTCGQRYKQCSDGLVAKWKSSGCAPACKKYNACQSACPEGAGADACFDKCRATLSKACPAPLAGMCMFNGFGPGEQPGLP